MTGHLSVDELADAVADVGSVDAADHLADCSICQDRIGALGALSADVTSALAPAGLVEGRDEPAMPADVAARITGALAEAQTARATTSRATVDGTQPTDDLALARQRRARRRHKVGGWLAAAAVVVVAGVGIPAILNNKAPDGTSANSVQSANAPGAATANDQALRSTTFANDVHALVNGQGNQSRALRTPSTRSLTGGGATRCAAVATAEATKIVSQQEALATPVPGMVGQAEAITDVTVDGRPAVLFIVPWNTAQGLRQVAVALSGCSSGTPTVLASSAL